MKVTVTSFSYKRGLPEDKTGNGGGFMFDCRAMPNPYWDESLRGYTGRDKPIAEFFDRYKDKVDCFLGAAETLVRQSIDEYLTSGRDHLQVAFGCTGGQHRSVYFAERMAERLAGTDGVELEVTHAAKQHWKVKAQKVCDGVDGRSFVCLSFAKVARSHVARDVLNWRSYATKHSKAGRKEVRRILDLSAWKRERRGSTLLEHASPRCPRHGECRAAHPAAGSRPNEGYDEVP